VPFNKKAISPKFGAMRGWLLILIHLAIAHDYGILK